MAADESPGEELLRHILDCAALERFRSGRAVRIAGRHEQRAADGPASTRDLHLRMARTHRKTAERHEAAAAVHAAFAARLITMLDGTAPRDATSLFMTAVANAAKARGAALTVFGAQFQELLCATSDERTKAVQDLEFVCGEGPTLASAAQRRVVAATYREFDEDWPAYGSAATELGVRRVVVVPVEFTASTSAALTVLDPPEAGEETGVQGLRELADVLFHLVLPELRREAGGWAPLTEADSRAQVHQAEGIIAEQLGVALDDASALLRARAYSAAVGLDDLAKAVIARRVRFDR